MRAYSCASKASSIVTTLANLSLAFIKWTTAIPHRSYDKPGFSDKNRLDEAVSLMDSNLYQSKYQTHFTRVPS